MSTWKSWERNILNPSTIVEHIPISHQSLQRWREDITVTDFTDVAVALGRGWGAFGDPVSRKWWNAWDKNQPTLMWTPSSHGEDWHWNLHWLLFSIISIWRASKPARKFWSEMTRPCEVVKCYLGVKAFCPFFTIVCFFLNLFWPCCKAYGILVPRPGVKTTTLDWTYGVNHWTAREVPRGHCFNC